MLSNLLESPVSISNLKNKRHSFSFEQRQQRNARHEFYYFHIEID